MSFLHPFKRQRILGDSQAVNGACSSSLLESMVSLNIHLADAPRAEVAESLVALVGKMHAHELLSPELVQGLPLDTFWLLHLAGGVSFVDYIKVLCVNAGRERRDSVLQGLRAHLLLDEASSKVQEQLGIAIDVIKFMFNEMSSPRSAIVADCERLIISILVPKQVRTVTVRDLRCIRAVFSHLNAMTQTAAVASLQGKVLARLLTLTISSPVGEAASAAGSIAAATTVLAALEELCLCLQPSVLFDQLEQALRPSDADVGSPLCLSRTFALRQSTVQTQSFFSALLELLLSPTRPPHRALPSLMRLADIAREAAKAAMETQGKDMFLRAVALVDHMDHVIIHTQPFTSNKTATITTAWLASLLPPPPQQQQPAGSGAAQFVQLHPTNEQAVFAIYALSEFTNQPLLSSPSLTRIKAALRPLQMSLRSSTTVNANAPAISAQVADAARTVGQIFQVRSEEFDAASGKKSSPPQAKSSTNAFLMAAAGGAQRPAYQAPPTDEKITGLVIRLVPQSLQGYVASALKQLDACLKVVDAKAHVALLHTNIRAALHSAAVQGAQPYSVVLALLASGLACLLSRAAKAGEGEGEGEGGAGGEESKEALARIRLVFTPVVLEGSSGPLGSLSSGLLQATLSGLMSDPDTSLGAENLAFLQRALDSAENNTILLQRFFALWQLNRNPANSNIL